MIVYYDEARIYPEARLFPYTASSPEHAGYLDFKSRPELIRTALEDFKPFDHRKAIQTFYSFLEWINGRESHIETNDSALRGGVHTHKDANSNLALSIDGRVELLYRNLYWNCVTQQTNWLCGKLMRLLSSTDTEFTPDKGVVGFTLNPALQLAISDAILVSDGQYSFTAKDRGFGRHLMLSFWAYGNDEEEVFENLDRLFNNIWAACRSLSTEIEAGIQAQLKQNKESGDSLPPVPSS